MSDLISRQAAIDAILEQTVCDTKRELVERCDANISDENGWLGGVCIALDTIEDLPSAQPEKHTEERTETHACDCISRREAIDAMTNTLWHYPNECYRNLNEYEFAKGLAELGLKSVSSAQPEIVRCKDCKHAYWYKAPDGKMFCYCMEHGSYGNVEKDYCARAERRKE